MKNWIETKINSGKKMYATAKADGHFVMYDGNNCLLSKQGKAESFFCRRHLEVMDERIPIDRSATVRNDQGDVVNLYNSLKSAGQHNFSIDEDGVNVHREYYKSVTGYMKRLSSLIQDEYIREVKRQILNECHYSISKDQTNYLQELTENWKLTEKPETCDRMIERAKPNLQSNIRRIVSTLNSDQLTKHVVCDKDNIFESNWEELKFEDNKVGDFFERVQDNNIVLLCEMVKCKRDKLKHYRLADLENIQSTNVQDAHQRWVKCLYHYDDERERYENFRTMKQTTINTDLNRFFAARSVGRTSPEQHAEPSDTFEKYTTRRKNTRKNYQPVYDNRIDAECIAYQVFDMYPTFANAEQFTLPYNERMKIVDDCIVKLNSMIDSVMQVDNPPCAWYRLAIVNVVPVLPIQIETYDHFLLLARAAFDKNQEGLILCAANPTACLDEDRESKRKFKYMFDFQVSIVYPKLPELTEQQRENLAKHGKQGDDRIQHELFQRVGNNENGYSYAAQLKAEPEIVTVDGKKVEAWNYVGSWGALPKKEEIPGRKLSLNNREIHCLFPNTVSQLNNEWKRLRDKALASGGTGDDAELKAAWVRATSWTASMPKLIRDLWLPPQQVVNGRCIRRQKVRSAITSKNTVEEDFACDHDRLWTIHGPMKLSNEIIQESGNLNVKYVLSRNNSEYSRRETSQTRKRKKDDPDNTGQLVSDVDGGADGGKARHRKMELTPDAINDVTTTGSMRDKRKLHSATNFLRIVGVDQV
jgi:hypothetical protein